MNLEKISDKEKFVVKKLNDKGFQAYFVGGCVRDMLLYKEPSDFDITTNAYPDEIEEVFSDKKLFKLGKKFGTIGVLVEDKIFEVTTFRSDGIYLDGRHPESVKFSSNLKDDLARRDFTINAMALDLSGKIYDYYGGSDDILKKTIRTVGNPSVRFEEDKLRMLRAVRFSCSLGFEIEKETSAAIKKNGYKINSVSKERIKDEFDKIILSKKPSDGILKLLELGLLEEIFPEIMPTVGYDQMSPYHHKNLFLHMLCTLDNVPQKKSLRLAALFHDIGKVKTLSIDDKGIGHFYGHEIESAKSAEDILKRIKYDNKTIKEVDILISNHMKANPVMTKKALKRLIRKVGREEVLDLMDLMIADRVCTKENRDVEFLEKRKQEIIEILEYKEPIETNELKINGHDLIEIGYKEGKFLGETLKKLTDLVIENPEINDKEKLLEISKSILEESDD